MPGELFFHVTNDAVFAENGYVVYVRDGGLCWVVDPGFPPQPRKIAAFVRAHRLTPTAVVLTHAHVDHIAGIDAVLTEAEELPVYLAREEWPMLTDPRENLSIGLGMAVAAHLAKEVRDLAVGMRLELDGTQWTVGDVSGHSPGGRSLYCAEHGVALVGDALFAGSVGRTDFHHSDAERLLRNIRETLLTLPDATRVLSGHGEETTVGQERRTNPYLQHLA